MRWCERQRRPPPPPGAPHPRLPDLGHTWHASLRRGRGEEEEEEEGEAAAGRRRDARERDTNDTDADTDTDDDGEERVPMPKQKPGRSTPHIAFTLTPSRSPREVSKNQLRARPAVRPPTPNPRSPGPKIA